MTVLGVRRKLYSMIIILENPVFSACYLKNQKNNPRFPILTYSFTMKYLDGTYLATRPNPLYKRDAGQSYARQTNASALPFYASFLLLIRWILRWAVDDAAPEAPVYQRRHVWAHVIRPKNRKTRRRPIRPTAPANDFRPFLIILSGSTKKTQFIEKVARVSVIGRIDLYCIRYWHAVRLSMTKLSPFDFGGWSMPKSAIQADGLWDAQAIPN